MKTFLLWVLCFTVSSLPALAQNFDQVSQASLCEGIKHILSLRESRFEAIRSRPEPDDKSTFPTTFKLPGMHLCNVREIGSLLFYTCAADAPFGWRNVNPRQLDAYLETVHSRFAACIKPPSISRGEAMGKYITYNIAPFPEADSLRSAVVISVLGRSFVSVKFNTLRQ
jgi:hypothetical protein